MSLAVHEFRTPVSVAAGYSRMLMKGHAGELSEKQQRLVGEIEKSCARLSALVAELSDLSKLDDGSITLKHLQIPLFTLIAQVAEGVHEGADRGVRLEVRRPPEDVVIMGDPDRLRSTLSALFAANLREKVDDTHVVADCSRRTIEGSPSAVLIIADAAELDRLSEISPRTWGVFEQWRGGVGLSLPIAERIVAAHGGRLWSPPAPRSRAATAVTFPLQENPS